MPDPRLNCAAEICCPPPTMLLGATESPRNEPADEACSNILLDLGVNPEDVKDVVSNMRKRGIVLLSAELATAIRHVAFPKEP